MHGVVPRADADGSADAFSLFKQIDAHDPVDDDRAALARFAFQDAFLVFARIVQVIQHVAGHAVSGELPAAVVFHGNAPGVPQFDDFKGSGQPGSDEFDVADGSLLAGLEFLNPGIEVIAVIFRDVALEVIVARCARAAVPDIALVRHNDAKAQFRRSDCGHKPGYAAADDQQIRFMMHSVQSHVVLLVVGRGGKTGTCRARLKTGVQRRSK